MPVGTSMLLALVLLPALAAPQPARWSHIRSTNSRIRAAIEEGYARSKTFRSLVDQLEGSNVILHIERGDCTCYYARACLGFISSAGGIRYLRSHVSLRQVQHELIQHIGHELFHAWEIAAAPEVTSRADFTRFFAGLRASGCREPKCYETPAALVSEAAVRSELAMRTAAGIERRYNRRLDP